VTTEAAQLGPALAPGADATLEAALVELESRPMSEFRTLAGPAAEAYRRAVELGDEERAQRATILRAGVLLREGRIGEGGQIAQQVRAWAEQHDSPYVLARAHRELSGFYRYVGDMADGLSHAVQCVAHLTDDVPPVIRARHLVSLAVALDDCGSTEEGDRRSREALRIARSIGDEELTAQILNNMAYTAFEIADEPAARAMVAQMRAVEARTGKQLAANELDTIARVEMMSGRYDAAETTLAAVLADHVVGNEGDAVAECLLTLAELRRLDGRFADAQFAVDKSVVLCEERGLARIRARLHQEQAALYAATGRYVEAYEEHRVFHAVTSALHSAQRDARARALQAVFEATEARRASDHFREMAHRDVLTGLYNRRYVNERLPALLGEAAAQGTAISVAILDLDHFKRVNDTLSHATGDTVLQHIGELLMQEASGPAIAARMGGEEFLLILPGVDAEQAALRCERLRLRIRAHAWEPITGTLPITTSVGVTTAADGRGTPSALLSQADRNLYTAKRAGRDRVVTDLV
jgi:diguanylate cyclase (GGDEF)-like protein